MSKLPSVNLEDLLQKSQLIDKANKVEDSLFHVHWGSAMVVVGITEHALVVIAPMFNKLPEGREMAFYHRLLQANSVLGGMASFAIQQDGWIVLQSGRDLKGMDPDEFALVVTTVAQAADELDDVLHKEFFAPPESEQSAEGAEGDDQTSNGSAAPSSDESGN